MLDHCLRYYQNGDLLSIPRRAVTSVFWSKSCARPRSTQWSNPQGPDRSPAEAAEAAPATTPALPTTSPTACSWHTRLLTPPHMCEAMDWNHRGKAGIEKCSFLVHIWNVLFFIVQTLQLGSFCGPAFINVCCLLSVPVCWQSGCYKIIKTPQCSSILKPKQSLLAWCFCVFLYCHFFFPSEKDLHCSNHWSLKKPFWIVCTLYVLTLVFSNFFRTCVWTEQCVHCASCVFLHLPFIIIKTFRWCVIMHKN